MSKKTMSGKVAVITGSSMGIGKSTAELLAEKGAKVVINGRTESRLLETEKAFKDQGYDVLAVTADISTTQGAEKLIKQTVAEFGRIDIMVNNAGMSSRGYFDELAPEVLEEIMRINFLGCMYPTKFAEPYLAASQGSIVFISSVAGIRGLPETSIYCASKMALTAMAESLKVELSEKKIHVGIIYVGITKNDPGKKVINKDGTYLLLKDRGRRKTQAPEQVAAAIVRLIEKRKFKKILSFLGKMNALANVLFPRLVDRILIHSKEKIRKLNT